MSLHIVDQATKLTEMLEAQEEEKGGILSDEYSYGHYAYNVAKRFLVQQAEIERLRQRISFLSHIVDDPAYTIRQIQEIARQALEGAPADD